MGWFKRWKRSNGAGLGSWVEHRAKGVVSSLYDEHAEDLHSKAKQVATDLYENRADDLEDRAVRALRRAIHLESDRIREAIEYGIQVKKREVRLSLLVLVVASIVYLVLYMVSQGAAAG